VILRNHHGLYKKNFSEADNHSASREVFRHPMELDGYYYYYFKLTHCSLQGLLCDLC